MLPNSNPHNLLQLDAIFYSPPTNVRAGGPVKCQSSLYNISVYFETNYKLSQIVRVLGGGSTVSSYNPSNTIIGPAICNSHGLFTVTLEVNRTFPDSGSYTAAVIIDYKDSGFNTSFSWIQTTIHTSKDDRSYVPIYHSDYCPSFPSTTPTSIPTKIPSSQPTVPTVQPTKRPTSAPSFDPTVVPSFVPTPPRYTNSELHFTQVLNYVVRIITRICLFIY